MNTLLAAVLLSLVSAVCYATAAIIQERLAATTQPGRGGLLRSPRWWGAVALNAAGALLHVVALGLGPLTVVQPLGVLTLVLAAPLAALLVNRPLSANTWQGIVIVSGGLAVLLVLTGSTPARGLSAGGQLTLAAAVACALTLLLLTATAAGRRARVTRSVSMAAAAGVAYGAASVFTKTLARAWDASLPLSGFLADAPVLLLVGVLAAGGLAASQASYRGGGLTAPLATTTVVNPAFAGVVGVLMLGESFRYGTPGVVGAFTAAAVTAWGLFVLAAGSAGDRLRTGGAARLPAGGEGPVTIRAPGRLSVAVHQTVRRTPAVRQHTREPAARR